MVGRIIVAFACALLGIAGLSGNANAATTLQASVDRPEVHVNESFTYTLRADGNVSGEPDTTALEKQFDILQRSSSQQTSIVNGQVSRVSEWVYQLMPRTAGSVTIPSVAVDGIASNPVTIKILPADTGSGPGSADSDIFIEVTTDSDAVYVQSQLVYTIRIFVGVGTARASVSPPTPSDGKAIIEQLGNDRRYQTTRGGRAYVVYERRYVVFPQTAGHLTLGPSTFEARLMTSLGFSQVRRVRSEPVSVTVKPAVPPPAEFANAAWLPAQKVTLAETWSADPTAIKVGVPITRTLTITAHGVLDTQLPDLAIPATPGIRMYPDQPKLEHTVGPGGLIAERSVSYAVMAQTAGPILLPAVKLPWFDVESAQWKVAEISAHQFTIAPGAQSSTAPAAVAPNGTAASPAPATAMQSNGPASPVPAASAASADTGPSVRIWALVAAALAVAWLVTFLLWWRSRWPRATPAPQTAPARERHQGRKLRGKLHAACQSRDAESVRSLLGEWASERFPDDPPRSLGALAEHCSDELAVAIRGLEAHLYGSGATAWDGSALWAALDGAEQRSGAAAKNAAEKDDFLPLYR